MRVFVASSFLLVAASSRTAEAANAVEPIIVTYDAVGACPAEPDFFAAVRSYTTKWTAVREGTPAARTMRVRIRVQDVEATGSLTVEDTSGQTSERKLVGPNCAEVAAALAITVAVAIDPEANTSEPHAAAKRAESEKVPDRQTSAQHLPVSRGTKEHVTETHALRVSIDARVEVTSSVVSAAMPVFGASVELEPVLGGRLGRLRPSLAIGVRQSLPTDITLRGGGVTFLWTAGNLRLCPVRLSVFDDRVEITPCAELDLGVLQAHARNFARARGTSILWSDLGASIWATMAMGRRFFLSATALVTAPFARRPFALTSGAVVSGAPAVGFLGGLGVGVRF